MLAPSTGTYAVDLDHGFSLDVTHDCGSATHTDACVSAASDEAASHLDVALTAGEHAILRLLGRGGAPFRVTLTVP